MIRTPLQLCHSVSPHPLRGPCWLVMQLLESSPPALTPSLWLQPSHPHWAPWRLPCQSPKWLAFRSQLLLLGYHSTSTPSWKEGQDWHLCRPLWCHRARVSSATRLAVWICLAQIQSHPSLYRCDATGAGRPRGRCKVDDDGDDTKVAWLCCLSLRWKCFAQYFHLPSFSAAAKKMPFAVCECLILVMQEAVQCLTSYLMWVSQYLYRIAVFKVRSKLSAQVVRNAHHPQLVLLTFLNLRFCTVYCIYICV